MGCTSGFELEPGRKTEPFPSARFYDNKYFMAKSINVIKKSRGRPATGQGMLIGVRLQPSQLAALDSWITKQDSPVTRPEAIRAMMETILHMKPARKARRNDL